MSLGTAGRVEDLGTDWEVRVDEFVNDLDWSPDGKRLAVAAADGRLSVLDAQDGTLLWCADAHPLAATSVFWSPQGDLVASAGQDSTARLWNATDGDAVADFHCGRQWVEGLAWLSDGQVLTACGKELRLWTSDGLSQRVFGPVASTVTDLQVLADDTFLTCCYGQLQHWQKDSSTAVRDFVWKGSMLTLAASPDERWIAVGCQDRAVQIWDRRTGDDLTMGGYNTKVGSLCWDHTGRFLATNGAVEALIVWDCGGTGPNGREPFFLPAHMDTVTCVRFAHADSRFASAGEDGLVYIVRMDDRRPLFGLFNTSPVSSVAWSKDDSRLAVGYSSGLVRMCAVPAVA